MLIDAWVGVLDIMNFCVCVLLCYYMDMCRSHNQVIANNIMNNNK